MAVPAGPVPRLLAHRGHRAAGPENSGRSVVAAFRVADGAEVDVIVTADGVPVLRHDDRLPDGTPVRSLPLADLRRRVGGDADDTPAAADVLAALGGVGADDAVLDVELKVPGAARALAAHVAPASLARVTFTSFFATEVLEARACFPGRPAGLLTTEAAPPFVPPGTRCLAVAVRSIEAARAAHPGARLWAWTLRDAADAARARAAGAEVWIGDDVAAMAAWRDR